jgi:hypothetical protein
MKLLINKPKPNKDTMHKDHQRTFFLWIIQGITFINPKEKSPKIFTMHKNLAFPPKKRAQIKV